MKKNIIYFTGLLLILSVLFACKTNPNKGSIAVLDSLIFEAGTVQENIMVLSKTKVDSVRSLIEETQDQFNTFFEEKDSAVWNMATEYALLSKPLKNYSKMYESMKEEVHNTLIQLKSLQHDAEYELLPTDEITTYLSKEKETTAQLVDRVNLIYNNALNEYNRFDSVQTLMLNTINQIKDN